jgi:hypothetical protein
MGDPPADTTRASGRKRVIWDHSGSRNVYANAFNVMSSIEEISLLLGTSQAGQKEDNTVTVELTDRVALSPFAAKRFAIQLNHVIQEYELKYGSLGEEPPSPPKPSPMSAPRKTRPVPGADDRAGVLFRNVENLDVEVGFEQSFKIVNANLLENRFLLGVSKKAIGQRADERLAETCNLMGMPKTLLAVFSQYLAQGNYVHFGFEQNEQRTIYKVYLEFWERIKQEIEKTKQRPSPKLLHIGLKWDVANPMRQALTRYTWYPWLSPQEIMERVEGILDPHTDAPPKQAADDLISLALARVAHRDILYLDVTEEGNPRRSFDINVYRANLQVQEIYPLLSALCRRHSIPFDTFHWLYDRIKTKRLGHLAAGVDREGKDFFTVYYGVEGIFGDTSREALLSDEGGAVSAKYRLPARRRRVIRMEKTDDKADHLFQLVKKLRLRGGFEHSFKFLNRVLLSDRFLFGFKRPTGSAGQDDAIMNVCRQIDMPEEFVERFQSELHEAKIVLFGFEKNENNRVYKAYLEFTGRLAEAVEQDPRPESVLIHTGFKWDVSDNSRKVIAKYTAYPLLRAEDIAVRVSNSFYGGTKNDSYPIVDDMLDLAGSRTAPGELLYFEASEEGNPRYSFDINAYMANLRMAEIYPLLVKMARHYSIDLDRFGELYEGVKDQKFGHLSGGTDRERRGFLTVYFSHKGSSRESISLMKQSPSPEGSSLKRQG